MACTEFPTVPSSNLRPKCLAAVMMMCECSTGGGSEIIMRRRRSTQIMDPPHLCKLGHVSPNVQSRGIVAFEKGQSSFSQQIWQIFGNAILEVIKIQILQKQRVEFLLYLSHLPDLVITHHVLLTKKLLKLKNRNISSNVKYLLTSN